VRVGGFRVHVSSLFAIDAAHNVRYRARDFDISTQVRAFFSYDDTLLTQKRRFLSYEITSFACIKYHRLVLRELLAFFKIFFFLYLYVIFIRFERNERKKITTMCACVLVQFLPTRNRSIKQLKRIDKRLRWW